MNNRGKTAQKLLSLLLCAILMLGLVPASVVSAAVDANVALEVNIQSGYTDNEEPLETVSSGQPFYVHIRYAMNASTSDYDYLSPTLRVELPEGVTVSADGIRANSHIADNADGTKAVSVETVAGKTYVIFRFNENISAGSASTLAFQARFANMTTSPTKDGEAAPTFTATVEGSIVPRDSAVPAEFVPVTESASVKVKADGNWTVEKSIVSEGFDQSKTYYELEYQIDTVLLGETTDPVTGDAVTAPISPDSYGRLEFASYRLTDVLPPVGAGAVRSGYGAQDIEVYWETGGVKTKLDASQYTVENDADGNAARIVFADNLYSTFTDADALSCVEAGASTNSRYYVKLRYPTAAYTSLVNEDLKEYILDNTAKLDYTLAGDDTPRSAQDNAVATLSLRETLSDDYELTVKKQLVVGGRTIDLDGAAVAAGYAPVSFELFSDAACTVPARDVNNATTGTLVIDANNAAGSVTFAHLRHGVYYLRESGMTGFTQTAPAVNASGAVKIEILQDGTVKYSDGSTAANGTVTFVNTATGGGPGLVEFTKRGVLADGTEQALAGYAFALYAVNADGSVAETASHTASSDTAGGVLFHAVEPGEYVLRELLSNEQQALFPTPADLRVTVKSNETAHVSTGAQDGVFVNESNKGSFTIKKTDLSGKTLSGAVFDIYSDNDGDGVLDDTDTLFAASVSVDGTYISGPVAPGAYLLVETAAPQGYKLKEEPTAFTVSARANVTVTVADEKLGRLAIFKTGDWTVPGTGETATIGLGGAKFEVYRDSAGTNPVLDENGGTLTLTSRIDATRQPVADSESSAALPSGIYWLKEIEAPAGYLSASGLTKVVVYSGDTADGAQAGGGAAVEVKGGVSIITIKNDRDAEYGRVQIIKTDAKTGAALANVTFELWSEDGSALAATLTTGKDGTVLSEPVKVGKYTLRETTPSGYAPAQDVAVTVGGKTTVSVSVENEPLVSYAVVKRDSVSGAALAGATFALYDQNPADGATAIGSFPTGSDGKATFTGLIPGKTYWFIETGAPEGYLGSGAAVSFTAPGKAENYAQGAARRVDNTRLLTLKIVKQGVYDGETLKLDGAVFDVYPASVTATTGATAAAQAAADKASGSVLTTGATVKGETSLVGLAPGYYWVEETAAPNGYAADPIPKLVQLSEGGENSTFVHTVTADNVPTTGSVEIEKRSGVNNAAMSGVEFTLYAVAGDGTETSVGAKTTGANGTLRWDGLAPGSYKLVETAKEGYAVLDPVMLTVAAGQVARRTGDDALVNEPMGKIKIYKVADWMRVGTTLSVERPLAGAVFGVYKDAACTGEPVTTMTTGETGYALSGWLPEGTYYVKEISAPSDKYLLSGAVQQVVIDVTETKTEFMPEASFVNEPLTTVIRLLKKDAENTRVFSGIQFEMYMVGGAEPVDTVVTDENGVQTTVALTKLGVITTDENGVALSPEVEAGTYYFKEVAAPNGYTFNTPWAGPVMVAEANYGTVIELDVVNYKLATGTGDKHDDANNAVNGAVIGLFTDEASANAAAGIEFTAEMLKNLSADNEWGIADLATTANGKYSFQNLNTGAGYWVVELIAPAGYVRSTQVYAVTANEDGTFPLPDILDVRTGSLEIQKAYKMQGGAQRALEGVAFKLWYATLKSGQSENAAELGKAWNSASSSFAMGQEVTGSVRTTGAGGRAAWKYLAPGYYIIEETSAPEGFVIDAQYYLVKIESGKLNADFGGTVTSTQVILNRATYGEFTLDKVDGTSTKKHLAATFSLERYDEQAGSWGAVTLKNGATSFKTSSQGAYVSQPLPPGRYRVTETAAVSSSYTKLTEPIEFTITAGVSTTVEDAAGSGVVRNYRKGNLTLVKYGVFEGAKTALEGVSFQLYSDAACTVPVKNAVSTNNTGTAKWTGLDRGTYYLVETSVGANTAYGNDHADAAQAIQVTIEPGKTTNLTGNSAVTDTAVYGKLQLKKVDRDDASVALAGAVFGVYNSEGTEVDSITTDANGIATSKLLAPGVYTIKELTPPTNYMILGSGVVGEVTVTANATDTTYVNTPVENEKMQSALLVKYSATDKDKTPLSGLSFGFKLYEVNSAGAEVQIGADNTHVTANGARIQSDAPIVTTTGEILFEGLNASTTYIVREVSSDDAYVLAKDGVTFTTGTNGDRISVEFPNVPKGRVEVLKVTDWTTGETFQLAGAVFRLYKDAALAEPACDPFTTTATGVAMSGWVEAGTYYLVETQAPSGFELETNADGSPVVRTVEVKPGETNMEFATIGTAVRNKALWGKFELLKRAAGTDTPLNAKFQLYVFDASLGSDTASVNNYRLYAQDSQYQTSEVVVNGSYVSGYIPGGWYYLTETEAQNGYTLDPTPHFFQVSAGATVSVLAENSAKGSIVVTKVSSRSDSVLLEGVTFRLYRGRVDSLPVGSDRIVGEATTGKDGVCSFSGLDAGTYTLLEIKAADGYELDQTLHVVEIGPAEGVAAGIQFIKDVKLANVPNKGRGYLFKYEQTNGGETPLAGAHFRIYASDRTTVVVDDIVTGADGYAVTPLLDAGNYWVVETRAPEGYTLDERFAATGKELRIDTLHFPDYTNADASKRENCVWFENVAVPEPTGMDVQLKKTAKPSALPESLLLADGTVTFTISDFTTGANSLPLETFVLTDDTLLLKDADGNTVAAGQDDYTLTGLVVRRAHNKDDATAQVNARVSYQVNGGSAWQTDTTLFVADVQNLGVAGVSLTLPTATASQRITGVRIEYFGTGEKFTAEPVDLTARFFERTGGPNVAEIVAVENTVNLAFTYYTNDNTGKKVTVTKSAQAAAEVSVPQLADAMPTVKLTNAVSGGATQGHVPGETLSYTVTAQNTSKNPFRDPILVVDVPAYTTLNLSSVKVTGPDGQPIASSNNLANPAKVVSLVVDGVQTQRLIFDFSGVTLAENQKITIKYDTVIDATTPKSVVQVVSPAFVTSGYTLPATSANPYGTSFKGHTINVKPALVDAIDGSLTQFLGASSAVELEVIRQDAAASVEHSNTVSIVKEQKRGSDPESAYTTQDIQVYPDGTINYRITVANGLADAVRDIRVVDLLPVAGDTLALRKQSTGSTYNRSTEVPEAPALYAPVEVNIPNADVTVYYRLDTDWSAAARKGTGVTAELPMLYKNDGSTANTWNGWVTANDVDLTDPGTLARVTAVGIDIHYHDGSLLKSGETASATVTLRMPGFTADEIDAFYDKQIANSAAASVRAENTAKPWLVENKQVVSRMRLPVGAIGDYAFFDNNANGIQDEGDTAATGLAVTLTRTDTYADGSSSRSFYTTTTDAFGYYRFNGLPCNYEKTVDPNADPSDPSKTTALDPDKTNPANYVGDVYTTYSVQFAMPEAGGTTYAPTLRYAGGDTALDSDIDALGRSGLVSLAVAADGNGVLVGETNLTIDAGFIAPCSLGDYVWLDTNRNGIQDETDAAGALNTGVADVTVRLYRMENGVAALSGTTVTDAKGAYRFDNLVPGSYEVEFDLSGLVKQDGYTYRYAFTQADAGGDDALDSDAARTQDADDRIRRTAQVTLQSGEHNPNFDAGLTVVSALGGFIFDDRNYNDTQDLMYPLGGTKVTLFAAAADGSFDRANQIAQTTVDSLTGRFYFDNLIEGVYYIEYDFPDGYTAVQPHNALDANGVNDTTLDSDCATDFAYDTASRNIGRSMPITLGYDTADTTWDAGAYKLGAIGDYVWFDADKDGLQGATEAGVLGVEVVLQRRSTVLGAAGFGTWEFAQRTTTDVDGYYLFSGLEGGVDAGFEYRVLFNPDGKYENTALGAGSDRALDSDAQDIYVNGLGYPTDTIFLDYGQTDLTWDMGLVEVTSSLGDYIWYDANRNGIQEDGEAVLQGVLCILEHNGTGVLDDPNAWVEVARMNTNEEGRYRFDNLAAGYYRVEIAIPAAYTVTSLERGSGTYSNEYDSDAIHRTARASAFANGVAFTLTATGGTQVIAGLDVKPGQTIDHTGTASVTYYKTRSVYLERNTVDLSWDVGVYTVNTGDTNNAMMWAGIASMSLAALVVLWYVLERRKYTKEG